MQTEALHSETRAYDKTLAERVLPLFFARLDTYGRELPGEKVITAKAEVSPALIQAHLEGQLRIGAHSTSLDNLCCWGCIDIDHTGHEKPLSPEEHARLLALGPALVQKGAELGLTLYLELSKRGAWHVWLFCAELTPARVLRLVLRYLLAECGMPFPRTAKSGGPHGAVELFPGQDDICGGYGNWVYLPYFACGAGGCAVIVSVQADDTLTPLTLGDFLAQLQRVSPSRLQVLAERQEVRDRQQTNGHTQQQIVPEDRVRDHMQSKLSPEEIERIRSALPYILASNYNQWLKVGMALHHAEASHRVFMLWRAWSATCPEKFDKEDCQRKWKSFTREGVTLGTLFEYTFQRGWTGNTGNGAQEKGKNPEQITNSDLSWPVLADEALYGLPGDIVRKINPYTEADRVAVLLNILTAFGSTINVTAHTRVQHDIHPCRLFVVQVGESSKGRKGTGWSTPRYLFSLCDPDWSKDRVKGGLSSGEGLGYNVRDPLYKKEPIKENRRVVDYQDVLVDQGERDKRLLIVEPEFASVLTVANREGNTLSEIIRQAWDNGNLLPMTKNNPLKATNAHISLLGHITNTELLARLDDTSKSNGFANRFLWALVRRSKELPEGGAVPEDILLTLADRLQEAIAFARTTSEVKRDQEATALRKALYSELTAGKPGLVGKIIARAEAQVLRLSVTYALLDLSSVVRPVHLRAALAVWEYCEHSVALIFGQHTGNPTADRILKTLRDAGKRGMTDSEIHELFGRNKSAADRARALELLTRFGLVTSTSYDTGGRPRTVWIATQ